VKWLTWDQSAVVVALCLGTLLALRFVAPTPRTRAASAAARELALVGSLYTIWRLARQLPLVREDGAIERARTIDEWQQWMHLPTEISLQRFVVEHEWLAWATNAYYALVHVPSIVFFLIWLFVFHRDHYPHWRNGLAILTFFCLVIRFLRVAPPRFIPELGFVDLSASYGLSVYGPVGTGVSDQFAAMPSIHVGWAAVVSLGAFSAIASWWRYLWLGHLAITLFVVAATGHHWWLDGIVAIALLGLGLLMDSGGRSLGERLTSGADPPDTSEDLDVDLVGGIGELSGNRVSRKPSW